MDTPARGYSLTWTEFEMPTGAPHWAGRGSTNQGQSVRESRQSPSGSRLSYGAWRDRLRGSCVVLDGPP